MPEERPNMKKTRSVAQAIEPTKPIPTVAILEEKERKLPDESLSLSPERIMDGASMKTALLNQILAQQEELHQLRHWGINE
jgi:hypothetical protein